MITLHFSFAEDSAAKVANDEMNLDEMLDPNGKCAGE